MMIKPLVVATLLAAAASVSLGSAWAGATDYAFEPAQVEVKAGPDRSRSASYTSPAVMPWPAR